MTPARATVLAIVAMMGCAAEPPEPGRARADQRAAVFLSMSGLLPDEVAGGFTGKDLEPGQLFDRIVHPLDQAGEPLPAFRMLQLEMPRDFYGAVIRGVPAPDEFVFMVRFHLRADMPLITRSVSTDDIVSATALLQVPLPPFDATTDTLVYNGDVAVDVLATDLATGAAWGRFTTRLTSADQPGEVWPVFIEFAAWMDTHCVWIGDPDAHPFNPPNPYYGRAPDGRADECVPTIRAIAELPPDPNAPPVPFRYPPLDPTELDRWSGLD